VRTTTFDSSSAPVPGLLASGVEMPCARHIGETRTNEANGRRESVLYCRYLRLGHPAMYHAEAVSGRLHLVTIAVLAVG
jgi:hypothetical protein